MKKVLYLAFVLFITAFLASAVSAEQGKCATGKCTAGNCAKGMKTGCDKHMHGKHMHGKHCSIMNELKLTSEQQTKITQIKASAKAKKDAVLTPAQKADFEKRMQERKGNEKVHNKPAINKQLLLTESQKAQMKAIQEETKKEIRNVLTPEQQKIFDEKVKNCKGDCNCGIKK